MSIAYDGLNTEAAGSCQISANFLHCPVSVDREDTYICLLLQEFNADAVGAGADIQDPIAGLDANARAFPIYSDA